jgi:hypothetical protein
MAELIFDPNEYLRSMSAGPRTAEMFQEGQRTAAAVATAQDVQRKYQQELEQSAMEQPYRMAALEQQRQVSDIALRQAQSQEAARQEYARGGTSLELPGQLKPPVGAGYMAPVEAPTTGVAPSGLGTYTTVGVKPASYDAMMQRAEGVGRNPLSTAQGPGQFIDSTFVQTFRKTFPDASTGMTDKQILAQRGTGVETAMLKKFTEDNQAVLASRGFAPTNANTYLAHFLGAGGATKVLSAAPNTPIAQVVDAAAIAANPSVFRNIRTAGDMQQWAALKMGETGPGVAPPGSSGLRQDISRLGAGLTVGGIAETVGGYPATTTGKYFAAPVSSALNYLVGTPERGAALAQRDARAQAAQAWFQSPQVVNALTTNPTLLAEAQSNPVAFYQKYSGALAEPTTAAATAAAQPQGLPTEMLSPTPMGGVAPAGLREPSASPAITSALEAKPGVPAPAPTAMTYLRNPPKLNGDMQVVVAQDRELDRLQKYYAQSGDIVQAAETGLKRIQLRNTYQNLQGLQSITNFDLGDNISLSNAMSRATGRQVGIQPLTNGNFNLVVGGQTLRSNISRADLKDAAQYMLSESYRAQSMEMQKKQFDLQIELTKERAKAGYKVQEKQYEKLYEGITKLQVERLKLSGMKAVEGEDGKFFVYKPDGSYAAYVDPQGQIVMPDGTKLDNPSVTNIPLMIPMTSTR